MYITLFKSKLHRATVTEADLNYVGSITIDEALLDQADILPGEKVQVVDINNGQRFETYTIVGERGSGVICVNGAAARLVQKGDQVIIIAYAMMDRQEALAFKPRVLILDDNNQVTKLTDHEVHGQSH
ncbi:aspartate 1-decarboxylase [Acetobacterium wieringae]|uniref:Aspartate 1-decarboxylase n=1 Tax=Acetobacterium wieringae TaxID=52694 RepID=A0A1F2PKL9_9FIRM|nr:aspartate 1-decarboxylase [Acetobacterium wieringae]OFV71923.1 aspartate 1-decarboxylase precursor [Acetobacterium wieringae]VUZ26319.1 Aspartate 1-decarboxylase [Acetobacterium wieringae]